MKQIDKDKFSKEFGAFIREARESQGLLQADVAKKLYISRVYYTYIENGQRDIYFLLAVKICDVLHLNINDFVKRIK